MNKGLAQYLPPKPSVESVKLVKRQRDCSIQEAVAYCRSIYKDNLKTGLTDAIGHYLTDPTPFVEDLDKGGEGFITGILLVLVEEVL